jgi:hypothetical protein
MTLAFVVLLLSCLVILALLTFALRMTWERARGGGQGRWQALKYRTILLIFSAVWLLAVAGFSRLLWFIWKAATAEFH